MLLRRNLFALIVPFVVPACMTTAPPSKMDQVGIAVPTTWAENPNAQKGVDWKWLEHYADPTLKSLIKEAIAHHPNMAIAASRVQAAAANATIAAAAGKPFLNANVNSSRRKTNFIGFPDFGGLGKGDGSSSKPPEILSTVSDSLGTSLDLSWEIDVWGRIRAGESAALAQWQAAQLDERAAQSSLAAQVAKTWFALNEAVQQKHLAERTLATLSDTERVIGERYDLGEIEGGGTGAQLRLAKADVASAREQLAARESQEKEVARQLELLLGRYPKGAVERLPTLPSIDAFPPAGLPSEMLLRRPDLLAAERTYAAQGRRIEEAKLAAFPQLKLTASAGTSTGALSDLLKSSFGVWSLGSNILQPILTGGQIRAQLHVREAEERQALSQLQNTVLQAFSEVEQALSAETYLARQETALADAVRLAEDADRAAREDYRSGVGDSLTVFNTQARVLQFSSQLLTLRRLRLDTRINLHLAIGGSFPS